MGLHELLGRSGVTVSNDKVDLARCRYQRSPVDGRVPFTVRRIYVTTPYYMSSSSEPMSSASSASSSAVIRPGPEDSSCSASTAAAGAGVRGTMMSVYASRRG